MVLDRSRLKTPREHLGLLVVPDALAMHLALSGSVEARTPPDAPIAGRALGAWREELRTSLGLTPPVVVAGHQAEFFHAGVLAKNLAARALADAHDGSAAFVVVDSDVPKRRALPVPEITRAGVRLVDVPIPGIDTRLPMQCQLPAPRDDWLDFFTAAAGRIENYALSALADFQRAWLDGPDPLDFCTAFDRGRVAVERGVHGRPLPGIAVSQLSATPAFRAFFAHIVANARLFARCHNAARGEYRRRYKMRNWQRPVPALMFEDARCELPFWAQRQCVQRQRLWLAERQGRMELLAGNELVATIDPRALADADGLARLFSFEAAGWQIRPRALALSAFIRLFLADLFIHGIGGAKYDEITEPMIEAFLGAPPWPLCCVTATVHLPLPTFGTSEEDVRAARRRERDFCHNPQRYVAQPPQALLDERSRQIEISERLRADRAPRRDRRAAYEALQAVKDRIAASGRDVPARLAQETLVKQEERDADAIALGREYFFGLHSRQTLAGLWKRIHQAVPLTAPP